MRSILIVSWSLVVMLVACGGSSGDWTYNSDRTSIVLYAQEHNVQYGHVLLFVSCYDLLGEGPRLNAFFGFMPPIGSSFDTPGIYKEMSIALGWGNREGFASPGWRISIDGGHISPPRDGQDAFLENLARQTEVRIGVPKSEVDVVLARFQLEGYETAVQPVLEVCK